MTKRFIYISLLVLCLTAQHFADEKEDRAYDLYHKALIETDLNLKLSILEQAHNLLPQDEKIAFLYGKTLFKLGKEVKGHPILLKLSKNPAFYSRVYKYVGEHYYFKKKYKRANLYYRKVIENPNEDNFVNNYRLGEINGRKGLQQYADSNLYFKKAFDKRKYKLDKDILFFIAENYYYIGDYEKSILYLQSYPHSNKNNKEAFKLLIMNYDKTQKIAQLQSSLRSYLRVWPRDRWARLVYKQNKDKEPFTKSKTGESRN